MKKVIAYYDDWRPKCTLFVNGIKKLDVFNLIECKKLRILEDGVNGIDLDLAKRKWLHILQNGIMDFYLHI